MNPNRVSNCDIDTDYGSADRDRMKEFLLKDHMGLPQIQTSEIITFNTIALKGAVHDVCRGLYKEDDGDGKMGELLGKANYGLDYKELTSTICKVIDAHEDEMRRLYPEVFEYADIINGTIVSVGTHPSGVLVSDLDIASTIGLCSTAQSPYPVSMLNMKELDALFYVKLDVLGLANVTVINDACRLAGIERLTPDNTDLDDMEVWKSIRDDTTGIFQWSSNSAQQYIRKFMSDSTLKIAREKIPHFSMLKWMSFGNGLLRPACASYRDEVANGVFADNGFEELNDFLAPEAGHVCMQETIMQFLVRFCGYSQAESDTVRRMIAKKKGTETAIPEIERRFIEYSSTHYDISAERCAEVIKPFLQVILDASSYGFSWNHSDAYSAIGYICGYLRYYYPYEFCTAALNAFNDDEEQVDALTDYARQHGIQITPARYGVSRGQYHFDKERHMIAKGLESVKYLNTAAAEELYRIAHEDKPTTFMELLKLIAANSLINSRQLDTLISIDFFQEFGNSVELRKMVEIFEFLKRGMAKTIRKEKLEEQLMLKQFVGTFITERVLKTPKQGAEAKNYTFADIDGLLNAVEVEVRAQQLKELPFRVRANAQQEILGYVDIVTSREEDRRKLYILDCYTLTSKRTGKPWVYKLRTRSIGSGKQAILSVRPFDYESVPIRKGDIIYANKVVKDAKGYWTLVGWTQLQDI